MLAAVDLLQEFCLHLLGLTVGLLGLPGDWRLAHRLRSVRGRDQRRPAPAGRLVACGSRRHPWLVSPVSPKKKDQGMTAEQVKARTTQRPTCGFWCPWQDSNLQPAVRRCLGLDAVPDREAPGRKRPSSESYPLAHWST
jgi:hypothetical protein